MYVCLGLCTYMCILLYLDMYIRTYVRTWVHLQTHTYVLVHLQVQYICIYNYFTSFCAHTELGAHSRITFVAFVILGVLTFGISLLIWFIYLKCRNDEKGRHV